MKGYVSGMHILYIHTHICFILCFYIFSLLWLFMSWYLLISQRISSILILILRYHLFNNILCFVVPMISVFQEVFRIILSCNKKCPLLFWFKVHQNLNLGKMKILYIFCFSENSSHVVNIDSILLITVIHIQIVCRFFQKIILLRSVYVLL